MKMKISAVKINQAVCILAIVVLAGVAFCSCWDSMHRYVDDYITASLEGPGTWIDGGWNLTTSINDLLGRFQPFRLYVFAIVSHLLPEEHSFAASFIIHVANAILLFLLVMQFRVERIIAFAIACQFCVFGVLRQMLQPSIMAGGSGLCTFLALVSVLALIKTLFCRSRLKQAAFWLLSFLAYAAFTYSYETAFPMFGVLVAAFIIFQYLIAPEGGTGKKIRWLLLPHLVNLLVYFAIFRKAANYSATQLNVGVDSLTRFMTYTKLLLSPFLIHRELWGVAAIAGAILYLAIAIFLMIRENNPGQSGLSGVRKIGGDLSLFAFGLIWYFCSLVLLTINNWMTPTQVHYGHLYMMSLGVSIFVISGIWCLLKLFPVKFRSVAAIIFLLVAMPVLIAGQVQWTLHYGRSFQNIEKGWSVVRSDVKTKIDPSSTDAILIKNFLEPEGMNYYTVSDLDGAFLEWFGYSKLIYSGDNVCDASGGNIFFPGPRSYVTNVDRTKMRQVPNARTEIFYYDSQTHHLLPYGDSIDVDAGVNVHQTQKVRLDYTRNTGPFEAILRNSPERKILRLTFDSASPLGDCGKIYLRINDEPVGAVMKADKNLYIDVSHYASSKYLFIHVNKPADERFCKIIRRAEFVSSLTGESVKLAEQSPRVVPADGTMSNYGQSLACLRPEKNVRFEGWNEPDLVWRTSKGFSAKIITRLPSPWPDTKKCSVRLVVKSIAHPLEMTISINGKQIGVMEVSDTLTIAEPRRFAFDSSLIRPDSDNEIELSCSPNGQSSAPTDGVFAIQNISIEEGQEDQILAWDKQVDFAATQSCVQFIGWYPPEGAFRWANGGAGQIKVRISESPKNVESVILRVQGFALGDQRVEVYFNGGLVGQANWKGGPPGTNQRFPIAAKLLKPNEYNLIEFRIPGAKRASAQDARTLGFAIQDFSFESGENR